jgi:G protein-coupled receptor 158
VTGLGFRRGSYKCVCKTGYFFPNTTVVDRFFNGTELEEEYSKILEVIKILNI